MAKNLTFCGLLAAYHTCVFFSSVYAQEQTQEEASLAPIELTIHPSRSNNLVGQAEAASEGAVGREIFETRPLLRTGEIIETVPGMIATQHAGGGKANQYFLRGFNLDHGTDFRTEVDGVPVNLVTHGHGQGYTDLNFLIPELVEFLEFSKGPYQAEEGDFAVAGAANFVLSRRFEPLSVLTLGENDYARLFTGGSTELHRGEVLGALELFHYDGPFDEEEDSRRINAVLRYSRETARERFDITAMAYRGIWNSSDQIPQRAVEQGEISRLGTIDPQTGGDSNRFSLSTNWSRSEAGNDYSVNAYAVYYDLDLYSNFTYFLDDPEQGDQFKQVDERLYVGTAVEAAHEYELYGTAQNFRYGLQLRHDHIPKVALRKTVDRRTLSTVREDEVEETHVGVYVKNESRVSDWLRGYVGLRADAAFVDVDSDRRENSGSESDFQLSPKAGLVFGPWAKTEFYLNGGFGFHRNDARGTTTKIDPNTLEPTDSVDLLVEARGGEFGVRSSYIPNLTTTVSFWYLELESELVFVGDAGTTEALGASERYGIEIANFYRPLDWLSLYADYTYTHPRFKDDSGDGRLIPNSLEHVFVLGMSLEDSRGFHASGKWRYLGTRPLLEDGSRKAPVNSLVDLRFGYQAEQVGFHIDVFNVFDEDDYDIAYFYPSRLPEEPEDGVEDLHFHPVEPRQVRASISYRF